MPKIDPDAMDPTLVARLRRELDRVRPRLVAPRYASSTAPVGAWRLAPVVLALAFTGILALTAFATTGSPNPVVWTHRVQTVINPPAPIPTDEGVPPPQPEHKSTPAPAPPKHEESPEPSQRPQPTESPEPRESPEAGDNQTSTSDSGDGGRS